MNKSTFYILKMDCSAEEQLVRMKLELLMEVKQLEFDLINRKLAVYHQGDIGRIHQAIQELNLDEKLEATIEAVLPLSEDIAKERNILRWVLSINFGFFVLEMTFGWLAGSMGLVADSLDMLADALVYALSLLAVGTSISRKKQIARISGYIQMGLAFLGFAEIIRRFLGYGDIPTFQTMIIISALALTGNVISLWLIQKIKNEQAHMKASYIFTSNDIIINFGVIIAGVLVYITASHLPDLLIGSIVFVVVIRGASRILKLAK